MNDNVEKQLIELQNKVIHYEKNIIDHKTQLDEMSERAYFYENLHNHEQRELYDLEMRYADYKLEMESEIVRLSKEIEKLQEKQLHILDEYDGRTLLKYSFKKLKKKLSRR